MADSNTFPSDKEDEREQRLIRDLRHMYHTEGEIAQALSRVRSHLETSRTGRSDIRPSTQQPASSCQSSASNFQFLDAARSYHAGAPRVRYRDGDSPTMPQTGSLRKRCR